MLLNHQRISLLDKPVFERVKFKLPIETGSKMDEEACFLYSLSGCSQIYSSGQSDTLCAEDGVLMRCGTYISKWSENETNEPGEVLAVHFFPDVINVAFDNEVPDFLKPSGLYSEKSFAKLKLDHVFQNFVHGLLFYFDNPELATEDVVKLKLKELIYLLVNCEGGDEVNQLLCELFNPIQYEFKLTIKEHLYDNLTIENLAALNDLSLSSFKRKFKELYNESPATYIRTKRLQKAQELLINSKMNVSEIAYSCGFNDPSHFGQAFKLRFGQTPASYRKSLVIS